MPKFEPLPEPDAGEAPEVKYEPPKPPRIEAPEPEIEAPAALGEIKAPEPEIEKVETPPPAEKPKVDPDKALNDALAKVKRRVRRKQTSESHVEDALASLRKKVAGGSAGAGGPRGAVSELDARMRDYYLVLYNRMSSNWVMPPGVKDRNIEAVYVISIDRSGRITRGWFERESGNALFDQSVERAVAKSNPLQPLPDVYKGSTHEVGLRFTPAGVRRR
jgi:outer membrane biosynthesis protein TonB